MPLIMAAGHDNTIGHRPKLLIQSTNSDLVSSPLPVGTPLEHITNSVLKKKSFLNHYPTSIEVGIKINKASCANCCCQKHSSDNRLLKNMCEILLKY